MNREIVNMDIKILVMDVDGTLTDGKIYVGTNGELCKAFSVRDGYGIHDILIPTGIIPVVVTGRESSIVKNRCAELGITEIHQNANDKVAVLKKILKDKGLRPHNAAYIGDDLNDLQCMQIISEAGGILGCPCDAAEKVKALSDFVAPHNGGDGAVRDFIEWLMEMNVKGQDKTSKKDTL